VTIYTAQTAADTLGLSAASLRQYAARYGVGTKMGRDWIFNDADIEVIRSRMGKRGRPKKPAADAGGGYAGAV